MHTEYLLYGGIGTAILLCVIVGIINWVHLLSMSAHMSRIETEIEKKSAEFDSIRKQGTAPQNHDFTPSSSPPPSSLAEAMTGITQSAPVQGIDTATIEIVRNVRGSFENSHESHMEQTSLDISQTKGLPPQPDVETSPGQTTPDIPQRQPVPPPKTALLFIPGTPVTTGPLTGDHMSGGQQSAAHSDSRDIMDIVGDQNTPSELSRSRDSEKERNSIRVALYSQATKDADFVSIWKKISSILETTEEPYIIIDMANIMFLYEKEIGYIEKIFQLITLQGGTLSFNHCEKELIDLLSHRPNLAPLAHQTA